MEHTGMRAHAYAQTWVYIEGRNDPGGNATYFVLTLTRAGRESPGPGCGEMQRSRSTHVGGKNLEADGSAKI